MEEFNKEELRKSLLDLELEDLLFLEELLEDFNSNNSFDKLSLGDLIEGIQEITNENKNSKLSEIKKELSDKYINKYIKFDDCDEGTIIKLVTDIFVDPAFGGSDYAIKFVSKEIIKYNESSITLTKLNKNTGNLSYFPIILYSDLDSTGIEIIDEKQYKEILNKIK